MPKARKLDQATKDYYLRTHICRGNDHCPDWVTVSKMLRMGANPNANVPDWAWTSVEACYEMLRRMDEFEREGDWEPKLIAQTRRVFRGYLNQFAKHGHPTNNTRRETFFDRIALLRKAAHGEEELKRIDDLETDFLIGDYDEARKHCEQDTVTTEILQLFP